MTQHYARNTVEASAWCRKCYRMTMHRIDGVKLGPCLVCMAALPVAGAKTDEPAQLSLLGD